MNSSYKVTLPSGIDNDPSSITIDITRTETFLDKNKPITFYICTLHKEDRVWTVQKRYREFLELHTKLSKIKELKPILALSPFPPKIFGKSSDKALQQRQEQLEKYLKNILNSHKIQEMQEVSYFFKLLDESSNSNPYQQLFLGPTRDKRSSFDTRRSGSNELLQRDSTASVKADGSVVSDTSWLSGDEDDKEEGIVLVKTPSSAKNLQQQRQKQQPKQQQQQPEEDQVVPLQTKNQTMDTNNIDPLSPQVNNLNDSGSNNSSSIVPIIELQNQTSTVTHSSLPIGATDTNPTYISESGNSLETNPVLFNSDSMKSSNNSLILNSKSWSSAASSPTTAAITTIPVINNQQQNNKLIVNNLKSSQQQPQQPSESTAAYSSFQQQLLIKQIQMETEAKFEAFRQQSLEANKKQQIKYEGILKEKESLLKTMEESLAIERKKVEDIEKDKKGLLLKFEEFQKTQIPLIESLRKQIITQRDEKNQIEDKYREFRKKFDGELEQREKLEKENFYLQQKVQETKEQWRDKLEDSENKLQSLKDAVAAMETTSAQKLLLSEKIKLTELLKEKQLEIESLQKELMELSSSQQISKNINNNHNNNNTNKNSNKKSSATVVSNPTSSSVNPVISTNRNVGRRRGGWCFCFGSTPVVESEPLLQVKK